MSTFDCLCFIPAKAASVRLKKKNLLLLNGKEMIYYPIHNALQSGFFRKEDIILSTESPEIREVAMRYGANVPYLRDEKLARDPYGVKDVVLDFLNRFPAYKSYRSICILLPTSPLMIPEDIKQAYEIFNEGKFNSLMSVTPTEHNALRAIHVKDGLIEAVLPQYISMQSSMLEPTYRINGAIIIVNTAEFLEQKTYFMEPWGAYIMPKKRSVDIDTEYDFKLAQFLLNQP